MLILVFGCSFSNSKRAYDPISPFKNVLIKFWPSKRLFKVFEDIADMLGAN